MLFLTQLKHYIIVGIYLLVTLVSAQDETQILEHQEQRKVLENISRLLIDNYVLKDIGQACADFLNGERRRKF